MSSAVCASSPIRLSFSLLTTRRSLSESESLDPAKNLHTYDHMLNTLLLRRPFARRSHIPCPFPPQPPSSLVGTVVVRVRVGVRTRGRVRVRARAGLIAGGAGAGALLLGGAGPLLGALLLLVGVASPELRLHIIAKSDDQYFGRSAHCCWPATRLRYTPFCCKIRRHAQVFVATLQ